MGKKLSEIKDLLEANGIAIDELEDDELGPLVEARKSHKANQKGFTEATQKASEMERALQGYAQKIQEWERWGTAQEERARALEERAAARAEQVEAEGGDWKEDAVFKGIAKDYEKLTGTIDQKLAKVQEGMGALANGILTMAGQYHTDKNRIIGWINDRDKERMKAKFDDFDADAIEGWAKEKKRFGLSWEDAYTEHKASKLPEIIKDTEEKTRKKVLEEFEDRRRDPEVTEMGGTQRPAPPVGERPKEYSSAWDGLATAFEKQGIGRT